MCVGEGTGLDDPWETAVASVGNQREPFLPVAPVDLDVRRELGIGRDGVRGHQVSFEAGRRVARIQLRHVGDLLVERSDGP